MLGELRQLQLAINQTLARIKTDVPKASVWWVAKIRTAVRRISARAGGAPDAAPTGDYDRCAAPADLHQAGIESVVLSGSELARSGLPYGGRGVARERLYLLDEFDQIREYFGDV